MLNSAEVEGTNCTGLKLFPDHTFMKTFLNKKHRVENYSAALLHSDTDWCHVWGLIDSEGCECFFF